MDVEILLKTEDFAVFNKPAGLLVEHSPHFPSVQDYANDLFSKEKKKPFSGIVHRLDRPVSGALIIARKKSVLKILNEYFRLGRVRKTYLAVVDQPLSGNADTLVHWLIKDLKNKRAIVGKKGENGAAECRLHYRVLEKKGKYFLLELHPLSGKFHQIRAQLAAAGCPIAGDEKYGSAIKSGESGIALHAWKLGFPHPQNDEWVQIIAPCPQEGLWNLFKAKET